MTRWRAFARIGLLCLMGALTWPGAVMAGEATAIPGAARELAMEPVALYDALLAATFPEALVPEGVGPLMLTEWRDANDPDLAGAIGGAILADGDPFASDQPNSIVYVVYPDASGPAAMLTVVEMVGEETGLTVGGETIPALRAGVEDFVGVFAAIDSVLVYGITSLGAGAPERAAALATSGVHHLLAVAAGEAGQATPPADAPGAGAEALQALAAAPFQGDDVPFAVGSLVILPMTVSAQDAADGMVGQLLVRDADDVYLYPLAMYRFYVDEAAAMAAFTLATLEGEYAGAGETTFPYQAATIEPTTGTTQMLVLAGSTIVVGNAPSGDAEERQATALALAEIAVAHLDDVAGLAPDS